MVGVTFWGYRELKTLQEEMNYHKMRKAKGCPDVETVYRYQEI